ncbi:MAG TPA: alpha-hydroxy acid oxidase [Burkholderiales bacterium]|nr:alpha-hydroxy acid oxidase [Burkholderiales bacterium]
MLSLEDFEEEARRYLPRPIFGYINGGAETNAALRGNRAVWDEIAFVPKMLVDTTQRSTRTTLLGRTYDAPFGIPPMGGTAMAAYQGDVVLARVAAANNIPMINSGSALMPLEKVREAGNTAWFQAYIPGDDEVINKLVDRVERAGFDTLVVTVDVAVNANRENNVKAGFSTPLRPSLRLAWDGIIRPRWLFGMFLRTLLVHGMPHFENMGPRVPMLTTLGKREAGRRDRLNWKHLEMIRRRWKGKLLIKGVLDRGDARIARESGLDGVMVSNHGGRQLDGATAPLRVLPGIVEEARGQMAVTLDSGVRRGTDVLKALALGANFVFVGRPFLYAASIAGEAGVHHAFRLLQEEIYRDMALLGINTLAEMKRDLLMPARGTDFLK